jgi:hypothetical protein
MKAPTTKNSGAVADRFIDPSKSTVKAEFERGIDIGDFPSAQPLAIYQVTSDPYFSDLRHGLPCRSEPRQRFRRPLLRVLLQIARR